MLTAEELLAGSQLTYLVIVPPEILRPVQNGHETRARDSLTVRLRPLTVGDLQMIARAAKESDTLVATLMVQQALQEPKLTVPQVAAMHVGLMQFLLEQVNRISGISLTADDLHNAVDAPLAKAAFVLAREYGWTPQEVNNLTLGQVLLHLQMVQGQHSPR